MKQSLATGLPIAIAITLGLALWFSFSTFQTMQNGMADRYAGMQVGYLIADHLETTQQWPRSWDDLRPQYEKHFGTGDKNDEHWRDLQNRVVVMWSADVHAMAMAESSTSPPFPVVHCASGQTPGPTLQHEANYVIFETLRQVPLPVKQYENDSPRFNGLRAGDRITHINGVKTTDASNVRLETALSDESTTITVVRKDGTIETIKLLDLSPSNDSLSSPETNTLD